MVVQVGGVNGIWRRLMNDGVGIVMVSNVHSLLGKKPETQKDRKFSPDSHTQVLILSKRNEKN